MTADEEDNYHVAQANEPLMKKDISLIRMYLVVTVRRHQEFEKESLITWTYLRRWYSL